MSVGREYEWDLVKMADEITFTLLQAVVRRQVFGLCLDDGQRNRFGPRLERAAQDVIGPPFRTTLALFVNDIYGRGSFLDPDISASPTALVEQCRIDELEPGLGFVPRHPLDWADKSN